MAHNEGHGGQGHTVHHWESSVYPLILVAGIFFAIPIAFGLFFQYHNATMGIAALGIGTPLLIWGVAGWTKEGIANRDHEHGYSLTGLPIFIVSEVMIFLSLFAAYWTMRMSADVWPPAGSPEIGVTLPLIMTVILVTSSVTYHLGEMRIEEGDKGGFNTWLMVSIALGAVFLGCTAYEYNHLLSEGFVWGTNAKSTAFYSITGFHASHVLVGLCAFIAILIPALGGAVSHTFVKGAGIYWHFVDIVWFFVVSQVYIW
ncbi:MAG: heme-copper oxidase subunit III [Nitrospinae bacterium]|nr:heme-copper oxidase subunit III [Nitrospinota bacterium]